MLYKLLILLFLICSLFPTQGPKACTWYNLMLCLLEKLWFCDLQLADACVLCVFVSLVVIKSRFCYFSCLVYNPPSISLLAWVRLLSAKHKHFPEAEEKIREFPSNIFRKYHLPKAFSRNINPLWLQLLHKRSSSIHSEVDQRSQWFASVS